MGLEWESTPNISPDIPIAEARGFYGEMLDKKPTG